MKQVNFSLTKGCRVHKAFSEPTRIRILSLLHNNGEAVQNDLVKVIGEIQTNIARHSNYLVNSGLTKIRKDGKNTIYRINPEVSGQVSLALSNFYDPILLQDIKNFQKLHQTLVFQ